MALQGPSGGPIILTPRGSQPGTMQKRVPLLLQPSSLSLRASSWSFPLSQSHCHLFAFLMYSQLAQGERISVSLVHLGGLHAECSLASTHATACAKTRRCPHCFPKCGSSASSVCGKECRCHRCL
jgi:hypothetical protein